MHEVTTFVEYYGEKMRKCKVRSIILLNVTDFSNHGWNIRTELKTVMIVFMLFVGVRPDMSCWWLVKYCCFRKKWGKHDSWLDYFWKKAAKADRPTSIIKCLLHSQTTDLFNKSLKQFMWATCQYYYYYSLLFCLRMQMEMDRMDSRISSPKMTKFPTGVSAALSVELSILIAMEAV